MAPGADTLGGGQRRARRPVRPCSGARFGLSGEPLLADPEAKGCVSPGPSSLLGPIGAGSWHVGRWVLGRQGAGPALARPHSFLDPGKSLPINYPSPGSSLQRRRDPRGAEDQREISLWVDGR
ncbi:hypothetical protein KIL84_021427 [Mauremys mutica]|uniref:Uncharacterized protein n=1 Tax=Mauremys mutica TaxID=74926 RepID=A0A9D3X8W4_9SAUR|nr:hypothetical protein KIL84_021427 [Mauremys mutica]